MIYTAEFYVGNSGFEFIEGSEQIVDGGVTETVSELVKQMFYRKGKANRSIA